MTNRSAPLATVLLVSLFFLTLPSLLLAEDIADKSKRLREEVEHLCNQDKYEEAAPLVDQLLTQFNDIKHLREEIEHLCQQERCEQVRPLANRLIDDFSEIQEVWGLFFQLYFSGSYIQNNRLFKQLSVAKDIDTRRQLGSAVGLGYYYLTTKQYDKALTSFNEDNLGDIPERRLVSFIGMALAYDGLNQIAEARNQWERALSFIESDWHSIASAERSKFLTMPLGIFFCRLDVYEALLRFSEKKIAQEKDDMHRLLYAESLGDEEKLQEMLTAASDQTLPSPKSHVADSQSAEMHERLQAMQLGLQRLETQKIQGLKAIAWRADPPFLVINPDGKVTILIGSSGRGGKLFLQQLDADGTVLVDTVPVLTTERIFKIAHYVTKSSIILAWTDARNNEEYKPPTASMPYLFDLYYKEIGFDGQVMKEETKLTTELTREKSINQLLVGRDINRTFAEMQQSIRLYTSNTSNSILERRFGCFDGGSALVLIDSHNNKHFVEQCGGHMDYQATIMYMKEDDKGKVLVPEKQIVSYHKKSGAQWGPSILNLSSALDNEDNLHLLWLVNGGSNNFSYSYRKIDTDGKKVVPIDM